MTLVRTYQSFRNADGYVFPVTAEVITAASCEEGDADTRGYCDYYGTFSDEPDLWDLRHLIDNLPSGHWEGDGSTVPRWITVDPSSDWWTTSLGKSLAEQASDPDDVLGISVSVHRPPMLTEASWLRVCRAIGWKPRSY